MNGEIEGWGDVFNVYVRPDGQHGPAHEKESKQSTGEIVLHGGYDSSYHAVSEHKIEDGDGLLYKGTIQNFHVDFQQFYILCQMLTKLMTVTQQRLDSADHPGSDDGQSPPPSPKPRARKASGDGPSFGDHSSKGDSDSDSEDGKPSPVSPKPESSLTPLD
jgi:hypothetical protein